MVAKKLLSVGIAALVAIGAPLGNESFAGGGGMSGGATEITQLANKAELIAQVSEAATQTATQISQLTTMLQNLQQLNPQTLLNMALNGALGDLGKSVANISGSVNEFMGNIDALKGLANSANALANSGFSAYSALKGLGAGMQNFAMSQGNFNLWLNNVVPSQLNLSPSASNYYKLYKWYEATWNNMPANQKQALSFDGEIDSADRYMQKLNERLNSVSSNMNSIANQSKDIGSISGNIQGLQFLANQNAHVQAQLAQITTALYQIEGMRKQDEIEKAAKDEVILHQKRMNMFKALDRLKI